ncbi:Lrp/AsnC family transcriptional regulator [Actinomadura logoneensis]|uniref:Lrp/AsnC family transcriptional regulator n=1 Tax=Actinomadura logoneensis TaxID=2293572 RepID=A0A372J998_9ACTN|nr:Lrp/AsnC family transcriptional regulator [Actinomadura logoneensis]RFU36563.1 Lrp/AsnC family transcriptional regulator [Actinomadura logoneensis]
MSDLSSKKPQPAPAALDGTDLAILAALVDDGRLTNAALAARVGVAESTCAYRVRALRRSGVIAGVHARLDLGALGHPIQAIVKVRLGSHNREHVRSLYDKLVAVPGALTVLHVGGDDDFLLHVAVESPQKLRDLILEHITIYPVVQRTETQLVFEVREGRGVLRPR